MAEVGAADFDDRQMALISKALILCPLPFRKTAERQVTTVTRVPGGSITTIISALDKCPLPYGQDAFVLDALSSEARRRKSPIITADNLADLMRLLKCEDFSGEDYRRFKASIRRIGSFAIRIKRLGRPAANGRIVDVDGSEFWSEEDAKRGKGRVIPSVVRLSPEYFEDLMHQYAAIPLSILDACSNNPTVYSLAKWIWWRADVSQTETLIPWEDLKIERGSKDRNIQRFKGKVRATLSLISTARPDVARLFHETPKGLRVTPLDALSLGVEKSAS